MTGRAIGSELRGAGGGRWTPRVFSPCSSVNGALRLRVAGHQAAHHLLRAHAFMDDGDDVLGDRHVDVELARKVEHRLAGLHTLGDLRCRCFNLVNGLAATKSLAKRAVT